MLLSGAHALAVVPMRRSQKGKIKNSSSSVLHCLTFPLQNTAGELRTWKKSKLPCCRSTYRQYKKKNSSGNLCASNLASLTVCIWKPGYFHKRHNPQSKQLKLLEENRPNQKFAVCKKEKSHQCILLMNYLKPSRTRFSPLLPNQAPWYLSNVWRWGEDLIDDTSYLQKVCSWLNQVGKLPWREIHSSDRVWCENPINRDY